MKVWRTLDPDDKKEYFDVYDTVGDGGKDRRILRLLWTDDLMIFLSDREERFNRSYNADDCLEYWRQKLK